MKDSQRVVINTIAQYTRTIINAVLSLYTVRVVLATLGQSDYGIYVLIAGVVAALGFITNSLVGTTQRYISYYQGRGDIDTLKVVFNNSVVVHVILGLVIVTILELVMPFLFNGFLNIPEDRVGTAKCVYQIVVAILFCSFIESPYKALVISHENIVYSSFVQVLDGILKVILVIIMSHSNADKLVFYSFIMLGVELFNFLSYAVFDYLKYQECIIPTFRKINKLYIKDMLGFAGWRVYGTACLIGRDQGLSVLLNRSFGTVINASWGIGLQLAGYTNYLSSAVVNAMSPQIVKAEGHGDRRRAIWLSNILSKLVFFLISMLGVPMIFEIDAILAFWLGAPPEKASLFGIMFILSLLIDSMTIGLTHINNAIGNIRKYTLIMNTPKLLSLLCFCIMFYMKMPLMTVCILYLFVEGVMAFVRIPLIQKQAGINVSNYFHQVIMMEILPVTIALITCLICTRLFSFNYRFILTFCASTIAYLVSIYCFGLTKEERSIVLSLVKDMLGKIKKLKNKC